MSIPPDAEIPEYDIYGKLEEILDFGVESVTTNVLNTVRYPKPSDGTRGIQEAVNDLPASGGMVVLEAGRYKVNNGAQYPGSAIIIDKDNVAIVGQGRESEIFVPNNHTASSEGQKVFDIGGKAVDDGNNQNSGFSSETKINGAYLSNFTINGNQQNNGGDGDGNTINNADDGHNVEVFGDDFIMDNMWSINSTGDGIEITTHGTTLNVSQNHVISNNHFQDCWEQCIHLHGAQKVAITGNVCDGEVNNNVIDMFTDDQPNKDVQIVGNTIINGQDNGVFLGSKGGADAKNILLAYNTIAHNTGAGVSLVVKGSSATNGQHLYIYGNEIYDNGQDGVRLNECRDQGIRDNQIHDNAHHGIFAQTVKPATNDHYDINRLNIKGNRIYNNNRSDGGYYGIRVRNDGDAINDLLILNNEVVSQGGTLHEKAIALDETSAGTYSNIQVRGNYLKGGSQTIITNNFPTADVGIFNNFGTPGKFGSNSEMYISDTKSGDGSTDEFTTDLVDNSAGLHNYPTNQEDLYVEVVPASTDAINAGPITAYADNGGSGAYNNAKYKFSSAPASGTQNVTVLVKAIYTAFYS